MTSVIEQLRLFLTTPKFGKRQWLADDHMAVYVRCAKHSLDGSELVDTLDIASVGIPESFQRQGRFSKFLAEAHGINPMRATYVENVMHQGLCNWFKRQPGWVILPVSRIEFAPPSFYKLT